MNINYKIVAVISFFLFLLAGGNSLANYMLSMKATETQIKTQSLPLSVNNIYTAIQKNVIEPSIIASMMANDTFLVEWLQHNEQDSKKIQSYLKKIQSNYNIMATFLVSAKSLNYYSQDGLVKQVNTKDRDDNWYYEFNEIKESHQINLDWNKYISQDLVMFINYKIYDKEANLLGTTGVGLKISYINDMLQMFKEKYKLRVSFLDKDGNFLLSENENYNNMRNINGVEELQEHKKKIFSKKSSTVEYEQDGSTYMLQTKYIPELNAFMIVEAKLYDFTANTRKTFYANLGVSLLLTLIIAIIIIIIIHNFHKKLEFLANKDALTLLANRRSFTKEFEKLISLSKRNKQAISLLFIDLDNFKKINDTFGHEVGDSVLKEFAAILKANIRNTDICARWGGEEFILAFIGSNIQDSLLIAKKISKATRENQTLLNLLKAPLTISAGLTQLEEKDSIDTIISRADAGMYEAKSNGKDQISLLID